MQRGMVLRRALGAALLAAAVAAPAAAAVTVQTQRVAVSRPDELGRPVTLDTDVYIPDGPAPPGGRALAVVFHGGGSTKSNAFDSGHARALAERGLVAILYDQRGHGDSDGLTAVAGPNEIRDAYDVIGWALKRADLHLDRSRIALWGDSQGGLNTNLVAAHEDDPSINPEGIRPRVLLPANTPDVVLDALAPQGVVKLSFGVGLVQTYGQGTTAHMSPLLLKWIGTLAAGDPLAPAGRCPAGEHDTLTSPTRNDLAWRSVGCVTPSLPTPFLWAQALDDQLFPPDMAIHMWRRTRARGDRLYLSVGGHATPAAAPEVDADELAARIAFLDDRLGGAPDPLPAVTYWLRDPTVDVPANAYRWPRGAWTKATAPTWPPPGTRRVRLTLTGDGALARTAPRTGDAPRPLAPLSADVAHDPVLNAAFSATPIGTRPLPRDVAPPALPGTLARFESAPLRRAQDLVGAPVLGAGWTPLSPAGQVTAKLFAVTKDGRRVFLSRGVAGLRDAQPGTRRRIAVRLGTASARLAAGTRLELWVSAGDPSFYLPTAGSLGGILHAGPGARLSVPLR